MSKTLEELFKDGIVEPQKEYDWGEKEYIARLEKALDKACSELESLELNIEDTDDVKYPRKQKHEWKEYLLNGGILK